MAFEPQSTLRLGHLAKFDYNNNRMMCRYSQIPQVIERTSSLTTV